MAEKKSKRPADQFRLPPHSDESRQAAIRMAEWKRRPKLPQRRVLLGGFSLFLLCVGMALALWLPSQSLVHDLRSRGVTAVATVVGVDSEPTYVRVRLVSSTEAGTEVKLSDYAGMYPDTHTGKSMLVTYDPEEPSRILAQNWVANPPPNLPTYGTSALAFVFLGLTVAVLLRRRWVLRTFGVRLTSQ
ncbi:hypothetical protein OOK12_27070 [Streptomyces sp. NBC_00452]|uniref:hypothetical protein n=1 Tax=Streptomyces sp. NBC_00452 TaxID=2975746 RepID=UPI0022564550|nr:hypothetical protein [Streptomyces sp. NBC_00452]MCX5060617.1 hypothetical protein [Streptomyces sp. NBC_00452]